MGLLNMLRRTFRFVSTSLYVIITALLRADLYTAMLSALLTVSIFTWYAGFQVMVLGWEVVLGVIVAGSWFRRVGFRVGRKIGG
ncbi:hypothetical protein GGR57DRAFT_463721 [Xylariaceae sp. FL1272]|nr:hypothetical protein GGR57DRAFT_463721 [Xylariaceae sp. FL1272]